MADIVVIVGGYCRCVDRTLYQLQYVHISQPIIRHYGHICLKVCKDRFKNGKEQRVECYFDNSKNS